MSEHARTSCGRLRAAWRAFATEGADELSNADGAMPARPAVPPVFFIAVALWTTLLACAGHMPSNVPDVGMAALALMFGALAVTATLRRFQAENRRTSCRTNHWKVPCGGACFGHRAFHAPANFHCDRKSVPFAQTQQAPTLSPRLRMRPSQNSGRPVSCAWTFRPGRLHACASSWTVANASCAVNGSLLPPLCTQPTRRSPHDIAPKA